MKYFISSYYPSILLEFCMMSKSLCIIRRIFTNLVILLIYLVKKDIFETSSKNCYFLRLISSYIKN